MTSQINSHNSANDIAEFRDCRSPENAPADYCQKLKNGIARLQGAIQSHYEEAFPTERECDRPRRARSGKGGLGHTFSVAVLSSARASAGERKATLSLTINRNRQKS